MAKENEDEDVCETCGGNLLYRDYLCVMPVTGFPPIKHHYFCSYRCVKVWAFLEGEASEDPGPEKDPPRHSVLKLVS